MITMNPPLPPVEHDNALRLALIYLNVASDPAAAKARLDELAAQTQALRDAIAQNQAVAAQAAEVETAQQAVTAAAAAIADREAAAAAERTRLDVAAGAVAEREAAAKAKQDELDAREAAVAGKERALADRLEKYRQALSA